MTPQQKGAPAAKGGAEAADPTGANLTNTFCRRISYVLLRDCQNVE